MALLSVLGGARVLKSVSQWSVPASLDSDELAAGRLEAIKEAMPLVADLSRADFLLYQLKNPGQVCIVAEAKPYSVTPVYSEPMVGRTFTRATAPAVFRAFERGKSAQATGRLPGKAAYTVRDARPIFDDRHHVIGVLGIETSMMVARRQSQRSPVILRAIAAVQRMLLNGQLVDVGRLSRTSERDGMMVVDRSGQILYVSGIAEEQYQKLGYRSSLLKSHLQELETNEEPFVEAILNGTYLELELREQDFIWMKKVIPLLEKGEYTGGIICIKDITEQRRKEHELRIKSAMLQEVHHRVKNNLQTIAALLRMQARRAVVPETQGQLQEAVARILSVAVVHEFLSHDESSTINIKEVAQSIVGEVTHGILDPDKRITIELNGDSLMLPAQQATSCALIINELLQNAVEHGYSQRKSGTIRIALRDEHDQMLIQVSDDGQGLPSGFDLAHNSNLGLEIVQTLAREDLRGSFQLDNGVGATAKLRFPKATAAGGDM